MPYIPYDIIEKIMLMVDQETFLNFISEGVDNVFDDRNIHFWKKRIEKDRPNLIVPTMKYISWRELYLTKVYEIPYQIMYLPAVNHDQLTEFDFEQMNDYQLNEDEIDFIYEELRHQFSDVTKVFDIHIDLQNNILLVYVVPNEFLSDEERTEMTEENINKFMNNTADVILFRSEEITEQDRINYRNRLEEDGYEGEQLVSIMSNLSNPNILLNIKIDEFNSSIYD
jgi:hypothetical protein